MSRDLALPRSPSPKMAPEKTLAAETPNQQEPDDEAPLTRRDLREDRQTLIKEITTLVTDLVKPLQATINDLVKEIKDASKMVETASEMALTLQKDVQLLQTKEMSTANRITALENRCRQLNLKFRGFEEGAEQTKDLPTFMAHWLAEVLELEDGVMPIILKAQRLGLLAAVQRGRPRDNIVQFLYQRTRQKILKEARARRYLLFQDSKIIVLLDLSSLKCWRNEEN
ncbi:UNVERIFIED_CONTAM: hypothetical protein K2H54_062259 [Gekko kuhli]